MKYVDTLIVGSGIAGSWLAYWLHQYHHSFAVIDDNRINAATKVASGVINPITGRRLAKTWLDERVINESKAAYQRFEQQFHTNVFNEIEILDFFGAEDKQQEFYKRVDKPGSYLRRSTKEELDFWQNQFHFKFDIGFIKPVYYIQLANFLDTWRNQLIKNEQLIVGTCTLDNLMITDNEVVYNQEVTAKRIIFCDGTNGLSQHFFDNLLPYAFNKGEALIVEIPQLSTNFIYKKGLTIVPWYGEHQFWIGSTYNRDYNNGNPTTEFYLQVQEWLSAFCKTPYRILNHISALRPTTRERRPFVGFHPQLKQVGVFNGMGTKGVSLSPIFGKEFAEHILFHQPLNDEVDVQRFFKK